MKWLVRLVRGFAMFWWDFLVGDTPEIFLVTVVALGGVYLVSERLHRAGLALYLLPLLVIGALGWTLARVVRKSR